MLARVSITRGFSSIKYVFRTAKNAVAIFAAV